jgi:hypothetical protein
MQYIEATKKWVDLKDIANIPLIEWPKFSWDFADSVC